MYMGGVSTGTSEPCTSPNARTLGVLYSVTFDTGRFHELLARRRKLHRPAATRLAANTRRSRNSSTRATGNRLRIVRRSALAKQSSQTITIVQHHVGFPHNSATSSTEGARRSSGMVFDNAATPTTSPSLQHVFQFAQHKTPPCNNTQTRPEHEVCAMKLTQTVYNDKGAQNRPPTPRKRDHRRQAQAPLRQARLPARKSFRNHGARLRKARSHPGAVPLQPEELLTPRNATATAAAPAPAADLQNLTRSARRQLARAQNYATPQRARRPRRSPQQFTTPASISPPKSSTVSAKSASSRTAAA